MSNVNKILTALKEHGTCTYDHLEEATKIPRNKLRWSCNAMKNDGYIKQVECPEYGNELGFKITPAGLAHSETICTKPAKASAATEPAEKPQKPAVDRQESKETGDLRAQLALAEQQRDAHFTSAETAMRRVDELLAEARSLTQRAELAEHNRDDLKKLVEQLQNDLCHTKRIAEEGKAVINTLQAIIEAGKQSTDDAVDVKDVAIGYEIRTPNKKPIKRSNPDAARVLAINAAARHGRADVIAHVPIGTARAANTVNVTWKAA